MLGWKGPEGLSGPKVQPFLAKPSSRPDDPAPTLQRHFLQNAAMWFPPQNQCLPT